MDENKANSNEEPMSVPEKNASPEITIKLNRSLSPKIIIIGVVACMIVLIFISHVVRDWVGNRMPSVDQRVETDSAMLEALVRRVTKLATLELRYTEAGIQEDQNTLAIFGREFNIPGTARRLFVTWQGNILFGINAEEIRIDVIEYDEHRREILVTLPEARILSHAVDMESINVLDESTGIFTSFSLGELPNFINEKIKEMETREMMLELLRIARKNAEEAIYDLFSLVLDEEKYTINFSSSR
jgi:hypothetical protein